MGTVWIVLERFVSVRSVLGAFWFSSQFTSYYVYSRADFSIPKRDLIGSRCVHPVTSIRGVFLSKFTSYYVYSWGDFGVEKNHPTNRRNRM